MPGLVIAQHSGAGKAAQYFLRGFALDHGYDIGLTLDGMPINQMSTCIATAMPTPIS